MSFTGFGPRATQFFADLAADNTREWWTANRPWYDTEVRGPLEALLDDLAAEFGEAKVFRPNRDTRFSNDKTPYKTNAAAVASEGDGSALYLSLSAQGLHVGGGAYGLERDQLARYRAAVDDESSGRALDAIAAELRSAKATVEGRTALKTAPRGFPVDHPRIALLRYDGVFAMWAYPPRAWLHSGQTTGRVAERWRSLAPLNDWLRRHVGPSTLPRR